MHASDAPNSRPPMQPDRPVRTRVVRACTLLAALCMTLAAGGAAAQSEFTIKWVVIGEAASADASGATRVGARLFSGEELAQAARGSVRITRVDVAPVVTELRVGQRWCLGALDVRTFGVDGETRSAPISITVRDDQRAQLSVKATANDICLTPKAAGEYPVRLTSVLPAPDSTVRGAQVFVRVAAAQARQSR